MFTGDDTEAIVCVWPLLGGDCVFWVQNRRPTIHFQKTFGVTETADDIQRGENKVLGRLWAYNLYVLCQRLRGNKYSAVSG